MIEINLIPDVKLELLKARRQRKMIISASILLSIAAGAVVVLLSLYAFGVQTVADTLADNGIKDENQKLSKVKDLSKTLTIQNQLSQLSKSQSNKNITSRLFDIISVTVPEGKNAVTIKQLAFKSETSTIDIEGEAPNGYEALEVFKKTLGQTTFQYNVDGKAQKPLKIATSIIDGERRYSEDNLGHQVLRFSLSFTYTDEMFKPGSEDGRIVGPDKQKATDSAQGVPTSLFSTGGSS
jgi:Tfp pilus assembly protein PilN